MKCGMAHTSNRSNFPRALLPGGARISRFSAGRIPKRFRTELMGEPDLVTTFSRPLRQPDMFATERIGIQTERFGGSLRQNKHATILFAQEISSHSISL
jgi:hypothetical protein